ncbi:MAG: hypothetical protein M1832_006402 [Thelocarpon impressellum]|nr:MAG: hypothetical protein M1832_006402 [Thelocarpon impressellum]
MSKKHRRRPQPDGQARSQEGRRSREPSAAKPPGDAAERHGTRAGDSRSHSVDGIHIKSVKCIRHWAREGIWPPANFERDGDMSWRLVGQRPASSDVPRTSRQTTTVGPRVKHPAARYRSHENELRRRGIHMSSELWEVPSAGSLLLCRTLMDSEQACPRDTMFAEDIFPHTRNVAKNGSEDKVVRHLSHLLVPSAELSYIGAFARGATEPTPLCDTVNERWTKAIPLVDGPRPAPDFAAGLSRGAFSEAQLQRLNPALEDLQETTVFAATDDLLFPFICCEVKCGNEALDVADRQNAHSASFAVKAVVQLFRAVGRQSELQGEILAFSISHDDKNVRIYGHYALMDGQKTSFHRHEVHNFSIGARDGRERWASHRFTKNVYDLFVPKHAARIRGAIDRLPDAETFDVPTLSRIADEGEDAMADKGEDGDAPAEAGEDGDAPAEAGRTR